MEIPGDELSASVEMGATALKSSGSGTRTARKRRVDSFPERWYTEELDDPLTDEQKMMNQEHAAWLRKREAQGKGPCLSDHSSDPSILDDIKSVDVDSDYTSEDSEGVYEVIEDTADRVQAQIDDHHSGAKKPKIDQFLKEFQASRANTAGANADITVPNK